MTPAETIRAVVDPFSDAFDPHDAEVFIVRDGKVVAKLAYAKG